MSFNSKYTGEQVESILDNILTEDKVRLIHFENKEDFNTEVANGNILDNSIVFIQDSKEIWNHGTIYKSVKINGFSLEYVSVQVVLFVIFSKYIVLLSKVNI